MSVLVAVVLMSHLIIETWTFDEIGHANFVTEIANLHIHQDSGFAIVFG